MHVSLRVTLSHFCCIIITTHIINKYTYIWISRIKSARISASQMIVTLKRILINVTLRRNNLLFFYSVQLRWADREASRIFSAAISAAHLRDMSEYVHRSSTGRRVKCTVASLAQFDRAVLSENRFAGNMWVDVTCNVTSHRPL